MGNSIQDSNITILVPTYNRYHYLYRLLQFFKMYSFPFRMVILDSSSERYQCDDFRKYFESERITYLKFNSNIHPNRKMYIGCNQVETPYVVLCADDDFIIPQALVRAIDFLKKNGDFRIAHGRGILFKIVDTKLQYLEPYFQRSIESNTASERLLEHLRSYTPMFYSVHHTKDLKQNLHLSLKFEQAPLFWELLPSCLSVIQGKAKMIDQLYLVRENCPVITYAQVVINYRKKEFFDKLLSLDFLKNYEISKEILASEIVKKDGIKFSDAEDVVKRAFFLYFEKCLKRGLDKDVSGVKKIFLNTLKTHYKLKNYFYNKYTVFFNRDFREVHKILVQNKNLSGAL